MKKLDIEKKLGDVMKRTFNLEIINREANENLNNLVETSETIYKNQVDAAIDEITELNKRIILVSGPSSSGKTTTSLIIRDKLQAMGIHSIVVSLDDFFIDRDKSPLDEFGKPDLESFECIDARCFNKFIDDLFYNQKAKLPEYDFFTGTRKKEYHDVNITKNSIIIIEGLHALNPNLIKGHVKDIYKLYVCLNSNFDIGKEVVIPAKKLRLMRRLLRDYYHRGRSIESNLEIWPSVSRGEDRYIKPYKTSASYLIDTTHLYEPLIYATHLSPLLKNCKEDFAKDLAKMLKRCGKITKNCIPDQSLLWEFVSKD